MEIKQIEGGMSVVRCLRQSRADEDPQDYDTILMSALKVLSYMDQCNMEWLPEMSEQLMNVNGLKTLINFVKQYEKDWPKLLSLNVLHMMARKRALINFMVSYDISSPVLADLNERNAEIQIANLALLVPLLKEEPFINSI